MIDWLWLRVPVDASTRLPVGSVLALTPEGSIEWQTQKWLNQRGSHDATIAVRLDARGQLNISGSPAKFLQGHNLFGSNDIRSVAFEVIDRVLAEVPGVVVNESTAIAREMALVDVLRVDINESFATGSRERCHAWITEASHSSTMHQRGRGVMDRQTCTWGRGSRHFSGKAYCKGHELRLKGRQLPAAISSPEMLAYADDALRIEFQFNARYLKRRSMQLLCNWKIGDPEALYSEHLAKLNFAGSFRMTPSTIASLPRHLRQTYALWQAGEDVRSLLSNRSFYRHRRELLDLGVDIAARRPQSNVVRLLTVIEATPKGVPQFATGTPLYFDPLRRAS